MEQSRIESKSFPLTWSFGAGVLKRFWLLTEVAGLDGRSEFARVRR
jgi:hypothetical protein